MDQEQLQKAIHLVQSGSKAAAIPILTRLVRSDLHNEQAWTWLIQALPAEERARAAMLFYEQNPASPLALHVLQGYGLQPASVDVPTTPVRPAPEASPTPPAAPPEGAEQFPPEGAEQYPPTAAPVSASPAEPAATTEPIQPAGPESVPPQRSQRLPAARPSPRQREFPLWLIVPAILIFLTGFGLSLWVVLSRGGIIKPQATPTVVPVVALAPTSTPAPTQTRQPSPTLTVIPSAEPTLAVTATLTEPPTQAAPTPIPLQAGDLQVSQVDQALLVYVPAGPFRMGSDFGDAAEKPAHSVTLAAFWIDQNEVTNAQYRQCAQAGACTAPAKTTIYKSLEYYANPKFVSHPVVYINWDQASAYCAWAKRRLPSEAEWEKAARGTEEHAYPWGSQPPTGQRANFGYLFSQPIQVNTLPLGASPYHAADMAGNVYEWVNDWYQADYYASSPAENPPGPQSGLSRVFRGGSFANTAKELRVSRRQRADRGYASETVGFRCAVSAAP